MEFESLSENSTATNLKYRTGIASCFYHDRKSDCRYLIEISCPISRGCFYSTVSGELKGSAKCYFEKLDQLLGTDMNGSYCLNDSTNISKLLVNGSIIALGLKSSEYLYLASIRMSGALKNTGPTFLSIPVRSKDDIKLKLISLTEWESEMTAILTDSIKY